MQSFRILLPPSSRRAIPLIPSEFEELKAAGAFALTDDGVGVQSAGMMLEAMKRAAMLDLAVVAHCEDNTLINKGSGSSRITTCRNTCSDRQAIERASAFSVATAKC